MSEKIRQITLRIPEEIHEPARIKVARFDSSFQVVLLGLLQKWASDDKAAAPAPAPSAHAGKNAKFHAMLDAVLNSENDLQRKILTQQLEACYSQVEATASSAPLKKKA